MEDTSSQRERQRSDTAGDKYKRKGAAGGKNSVTIKVGMVGDSEVGKTSLMVKYVENKFDEDYICTLGVNFMEKTINIRNNDINFSIWDLGGSREFIAMLPLVCNDAVAILFMFDLSRKSTLISIKEWFRQARGFNKARTTTTPPLDYLFLSSHLRQARHDLRSVALSHCPPLLSVQSAIPFLIGTKYDLFATFPKEEQEEITKQARKFAKAMKAPLVFCSAHSSENVQKIFKIVLAKAFELKCTIEPITKAGEAILEY